MAALLFGKTIDVELIVENDALTNILSSEFKDVIVPSKNAVFTYSTSEKKVTIIEEVRGRDLDYSKAAQNVEQQVKKLALTSITLSLQEKKPDVTKRHLELLVPAAENLIARAPLTFGVSEKKWKVHAKELAAWITTDISSALPALAFDQAAIELYLTKTIADDVRREPENPKFEIREGKLFITSRGKNGNALNVNQSVQLIMAALDTPAREPIQLAMQELSSPLITEQADSTYELLADAVTDFKGSPTNRKKNIAHGMGKMNGVIVLPDEEFSLIKLLGPIDESSGFLPELVIKGKETKPEFGGGLCQVSTTLFRGVAQAGLPVLERRNHSYRVSYYEPPIGFDATIYFPKPDFRFMNDTKGPVLIQAGVSGTKARVQLWGTKDERRVEIDEPIITNVRKPGPAKMIETDTLKPGEKKCIEKPHAGADAYLERRVYYPDGTMKKDGFKSHYVVWPEICLIGKETAPPATPANQTLEEPVSSGQEQLEPPLSQEIPLQQQPLVQ